MTSTENGNFTGKSTWCSLVLRNKITDVNTTKLSRAFSKQATKLQQYQAMTKEILGNEEYS
jgi:hypothetical protein